MAHRVHPRRERSGAEHEGEGQRSRTEEDAAAVMHRAGRARRGSARELSQPIEGLAACPGPEAAERVPADEPQHDARDVAARLAPQRRGGGVQRDRAEQRSQRRQERQSVRRSDPRDEHHDRGEHTDDGAGGQRHPCEPGMFERAGPEGREERCVEAAAQHFVRDPGMPEDLGPRQERRSTAADERGQSERSQRHREQYDGERRAPEGRSADRTREQREL